MNGSDRDLISEVLLGEADEARRQELAARLGESEEFRQLFLDHVEVEAFLGAEAKTGAFAEDQQAFFDELENPSDGKIVRLPRHIWYGATAAAAVAACLMVFFGVMLSQSLSASGALDQVIDAVKEAGDRKYTVSVLRGVAERMLPDGQEITLDDATVYLRGSEQFVVIQKLTDGSGLHITGSDGQQSWTFTGDGSVFVGDDPNLFRRDLPGSNQDLPFVNLHDQFEELRKGYDIDLSEDDELGLQHLQAIKKSREFRGPREVHIWFDSDSGIVRRLEFRRPVNQGTGRRVVRLELVEESQLPSDFFSHSAHHEPGRPVETATRRRPRSSQN